MKSNFTLKRYFIILVLLVLSVADHAQNYNNIEFIENKGQWDQQVKFKGDVSAGAFFIRQNGFTVLQNNRDDLLKVFTLLHNRRINDSAINKGVTLLRSHSYNVDFLGASSNLEIVPDKPLATYNNYFIGNDPSKWASNCRIYQAITIRNVYPNVDVRYYTDNGTLKYDIIARPGADINQIAMKYDGADKLR